MTYKKQNQYIMQNTSLFAIVFMLLKATNAQDECRTPTGQAGTCILLSNCRPLLELEKSDTKTSDDVIFLRQSSCGFTSGFKPKICCLPETEWKNYQRVNPVMFPTIEYPVTPEPKTGSNYDKNFPIISYTDNSHCAATLKSPDIDSECCGLEASSSFKIIGGQYTNVDQYPWLALLEYENGKPECGGSLISSRYVLTAAHCLERTIFGNPKRVRLSEYNTSSYPTDIVEVDGGGFEYITVLIFNIEREIRHPLYSQKQNDIGLVKLSKNAPYTDFVRPICLPTTDVTLSVNDNTYFIVAGWGSNGKTFNEIKSDLSIPFVPMDKCRNSYNEITDRQICAGGEKGKDSCRGDSGGPLMNTNGYTYILIGIVSYGHQVCGKEGTPAIYTNVYKYLDWIKNETT